MIHDITSYVAISVYILSWFLVCYTYYKKVGLTCGLVVIGSYLIYGILALLLYSDASLGSSYKELGIFPFIYLFIMLYIFLVPVFKYERACVYRVVRPDYRIVQIFLLTYSIAALVILPNLLSTLQEGLTLLLLETSGGAELYESAHDNYVKRTSGVSGLYGLFSIFYNIFSDISKFFFFYYLTINNKKKVYILLFCVVFVFDLLSPISKGGRTAVVMNVFSLFMALMLFYPYFSNKLKKISKAMSLVLLGVVAVPFMALTVSRFGEKDSGTAGGILSYAGQAPLNFNINALDAGGTRNGDRTINLFKQFILNDVPEDVPEVRSKYNHLKMDDSIFSTYVGDFVLDYGPIGAFVIFVCVSLYFNSKIRVVNRTTSLKSLLLVYFILCVAMHGGMYLFYYSFLENLKILAFLFTYVALCVYPHSREDFLYKSL